MLQINVMHLLYSRVLIFFIHIYAIYLWCDRYRLVDVAILLYEIFAFYVIITIHNFGATYQVFWFKWTVL
jgi:hypothetical protein